MPDDSRDPGHRRPGSLATLSFQDFARYSIRVRNWGDLPFCREGNPSLPDGRNLGITVAPGAREDRAHWARVYHFSWDETSLSFLLLTS